MSKTYDELYLNVWFDQILRAGCRIEMEGCLTRVYHPSGQWLQYDNMGNPVEMDHWVRLIRHYDQWIARLEK